MAATGSTLSWDTIGERYYETGVDKGVLYVWDSTNNTYGKGVAWNGLTSVSEKPSGAEATALYADNIKYLNLISNEEFGATIEAYTYPDEFAECDGSKAIATGVIAGQQKRKKFALSYQTKLGNDTDGNDYGYKIHIIYGCMAAPSERGYSTINDSPEAITFSWEITTTPEEVGTGFRPTACITIDASKYIENGVKKPKLVALENKLYGLVSEDPAGNDPEVPSITWIVSNFTTGNG